MSEISSKQDFAAFILQMRRDFLSEEDYWQNTTVDSFLGAMVHWVEHRMEDYFERDNLRFLMIKTGRPLRVF